jgi:uncharacterized protein YcbK (DUF882 family)
MLAAILKLHLLLHLFTATVSGSAGFAGAHFGPPVAVHLYDENNRVDATVMIHRDGTMDEATATELWHLFRDWRINREHQIDRGTLAMLTDIAERYPDKPIEFVSVYRATSGESWTSPHRAARAIDFRIRGINLRELRDYLWSTYTNVGVGWYPSEQFLHLDHRPQDMSWTCLGHHNIYNPGWAALARGPKGARPHRVPGV